MPSLSQAHVQMPYRRVAWIFSAIAVMVLLLALTLSSASATITVTPKIEPVSSTFSLVVSPTPDANGLTGQVTSSTESASVTAAPSAQGSDVPAHSKGSVILHNESHASQALTSGTRLASADGIIVRTDNRVDVPAGGTVTVNVTADPLGDTGNLQPGRLTIVALRPANQALIYGQVVTALTGGTTKQSGTLALNDLTKASDEAQAKIRAKVGQNKPGHLRLLSPLSVSTDPDPTVASSSYTVTVSMKVIDVTYNNNDLQARLRRELGAALASDQQLTTVAEPTITASDQPSSTSMTLNITGQGEVTLTTTSPILQPKNFVRLDAVAINKKLLASSSVKSVVVAFSPFWRNHAPDQPNHIRVVVTPSVQH